jgi:predicted deacetylase
MSSLIVSVHDVSPATAEESAWWVERLEDYGLKATLLVIPGPWRGAALSRQDRMSRRLLSWADAGHEVSLHGWNHTQADAGGQVVRLVARGSGEFATLDAGEARSRLEMGRSLLESNHIPHPGFTPPGWLISRDAAPQVGVAGFDYYTTLAGIHDLRRRRVLHVPVVCHRPRSRLTGLAAAVVRAGYHLSHVAHRDLRLAIHPDDTHDPRLVATTLHLIETALDSGWQTTTYRSYLETA